MNFKKLLKYFSVLTALSVSVYFIAYSCGWSEDECDSYVSFINPSITSTKNAEHFFYTPYNFFFQCETDSDLNEQKKLPNENEVEWQQYTGKRVSTNDIDSFINTTSNETLKQFYSQVEKNKTIVWPVSFRDNSMTKYFKETHDVEALGYIMFAKQCEGLSNIPADSWELPIVDTLQVSRLLKNGKQLFVAAKQSFIKERYLFQLIKTAFYGKRYQDVIRLFDENYENFKHDFSSVDRRIIGYKAGALFRLQRKAESAYLFSKLVDESNDYEQAFSTSVSFVWANRETNIEDVLKFCNNNHEKSMVYALAAMRNQNVYSLSSLQNVYNLDPQNKYLDILLIRELNKIEREYLDFRLQVERGYFVYDAWMGDCSMKLSKQDMENWYSAQNKAKVELNKFEAYLQATANAKLVNHTALWYAAAAYINLLQDRFSEAENCLVKARSSSPDAKVSAQIRVISLIAKWQQAPKITPDFEQEILPELKWFESYSQTHRSYRKYYRNLLKTVIPLKYAVSKDSLKMVLCYHKFENEPVYMNEEIDASPTVRHFSDLYFSNSGRLMDSYFTQLQLDELKKVVTKPASDFDRWLLARNQYSVDVINELKAVCYLRNFDYKMASQTIALNQQQPIVVNPFVAHIRDRQEGYFEDSLHSYSLQKLLDTLIVLKQASKNDVRKEFDYACLLYSMSYHGKCHRAWTFNRSYTAIDPYYYHANGSYTPFEMQYYYADDAMKLFEHVYATATQKELKQRSLWMLAKCQQKRCNLEKPSYLGWYGDDNEEAKAYIKWNITSNTYLAKFYHDMKGSPYYDEVYQECSYLQLYASRQK